MSNFAKHHNETETSKDEWLTPPEIVKACGPFDLDPCSPVNRPWATANHHFTEKDDGLLQNWSEFGRVWMNPPYNRFIGDWFERLANHNNGIALVFARTETIYWHTHIFPKASGLFFFEKRLSFYHVTGKRGNVNAGAPSVLISYGTECAEVLRNLIIGGKFISLK